VGKNPHKWLNHAGLRVFQKWAQSGQSGQKTDQSGQKYNKNVLTTLLTFPQKCHLPTFAHFLPTFCPLLKPKVGKEFSSNFNQF
jgi:hypothetical protein